MDTDDARKGSNWRVVIAAGLVIFVAQLDATIVSVAMPTIEAEFGIGTSASQWVMLAYLVPLIALSLLAGRWLDTVGYRMAFVIALGGFTVASVFAGASPNATMLIASRSVQGTFGAVLLALAPVLAVKAVDEQLRGRALGVVAGLAPLGAMAGPVLGGYLIDTLAWSAIFYVKVPIAFLILAVGLPALPVGGPKLRLPQRSWVGEAALLGTAVTVVLLAATFAVNGRWAWAAIAVVAPVLMLAWRRMDSSRAIRSMVSSRGLAAVHISLASCYTVLLLVQFLVPFYLTRTLGVAPTRVGLTLLALPATTAVLGIVSGGLADWFGTRRIALLGAGISTAGTALLVPLASTWVPGSVAWRLAVLGAGLGLLITPTTSLAMSLAPQSLLGVTAASTNIARYLGLALGPALATGVWAATGYTLGGMRAAIAAATAIGLMTIVTLLRGQFEVTAQPQTDAAPVRATLKPAVG